MKNIGFIVLFFLMITCVYSSLQAQIRDTTRVYDTVSASDTFYLFPATRPCINPNISESSFFVTSNATVYVATDTVTVYGVALTIEENNGYLYADHPVYGRHYRALLLNRIGISQLNNRAYSFEIVDSVTLYRSHPRFCWFQYENEDTCGDKRPFTAPCYELYFDTPAQINRMTDTFYVGRYKEARLGITINEFGGQYINSSLPGTWYQSPFSIGSPWLDYFFPNDYGASTKYWGIAFPIIGFRCGPVKQYWLDEYMNHNAMVKWRNAEEGTLYNLRLVGEDGSDTTIVTSDTVFVFNGLSDSVRYNVMLRKQCHYATSNYDTTVYSEWATSLYFGTTILDTVWRTVSVGSNHPYMGLVSGGGVYEDSSTVTLSATPFDGYAFDGWDDGDTANPRQVLVVSDTAFTALFHDVGDTVGIRQAIDKGFVLQPNPASGTVQVLLPSPAQGGRLSICDLAGRELAARTVNGTTMELDISTLTPGAYIVRIHTIKGTAEKKLVVR